MLNKIFPLFLSLCWAFIGFSQELVQSYEIPDGAQWNVNGRGDFIYIHKNQVVVNTADNRTLKQSIKSLGEIAQFEVVNSLKYLVFSFEQQMICFFDNSLSNMDDCLDLDEMGFIQVTKVAPSSQADKLWLYDEVNSNLVLYAVNVQLQTQNVQNLKGMLDINEVSEIVEIGNRLAVVDQSKGIYLFDQYGTFLQFLNLPNVQHIEGLNNQILVLVEGEISIVKSQLDGSFELQGLGFNEVQSFRFNGDSVFIQKKNRIEKYRF